MENLQTLVQQVAAKLGEPWSWVGAEYPDKNGKIAGPNGACLEIYHNTWTKRVIVSGQCGMEKVDSISVSPDRSPDAIAMDIKRRFLPQYMAAHKKAAKQAEIREIRLQRANAVASRLEQAAVGGRFSNVCRDHLSMRCYEDEGGYFDARISGGDSISVQMTLNDIPPDQAEEIIKILCRIGPVKETQPECV